MSSKSKSISLSGSDTLKKGVFLKNSNNGELANSSKQEVDTLIQLPDTPRINCIQDLIKATKDAFARNQILDVVQLYCQLYEETLWLASRANVTCERSPDNNLKISSQMFRGETHIEFDKTVVSIFCILWVLDRDYEPFTACQNPAVKITRQSFDALHDYVVGILTCEDAINATKAHFADRKEKNSELIEPKTEDEWKALAFEEAAEALIVSTVLNDLGKVESVVQRVRARTAIEEVDHDKILLMGLSTHPAEFPSYQRLGKSYRKWLLEGLRAQFNFAQLVQAENVPGNLLGIQELSKMSLDMFNLHALFDMAGAAGHVKFNGSLVLTEATYHDVFLIIKCIEQSRPVAETYDNYLFKRGLTLGNLNSSNSNQRAILRLCCNLRFHTNDEAQDVMKVWNSLPADIRNNLRKELCMTGTDNGWAILLYYAPALLTNTQLPGQPRNLRGIECALMAMNKCFVVCRRYIQDRRGAGVFTAEISEVATLAKKNVEDLLRATMVINPVGEDCKLTVKLE